MTNPKNDHLERTWLHRVVGDWTYHLTTANDSDYPGVTASGADENKGNSLDGSASHSVTVVGFEPSKGRFTGSVVATMAPVLFVLDGMLAENHTSQETGSVLMAFMRPRRLD